MARPSEWPDNEVIEGVTLVDLDNAGAPWLRGKLHVLVLSIHPQAPDRIWLRHYNLAGESDGHEARPPRVIDDRGSG